jgi:hypothetical protein
MTSALTKLKESTFDRLFNGRSTHAQPVETKDGGWKAHLSKSEKHEYNCNTATKVAAFAFLAGAIVVAATVAPLTVVAAATAGVAALLYCGGAHGQAVVRTTAEKERAAQDKNAPQPSSKLKNFAKHLVRPF